MTTKDTLYRLIDRIPETELDGVVRILENFANNERNGAGTHYDAAGSSLKRSVHVRWPQLGPGAIGACVAGAWLLGILVGPIGALVGALLGVVAGDLLDQSQEPIGERHS